MCEFPPWVLERRARRLLGRLDIRLRRELRRDKEGGGRRSEVGGRKSEVGGRKSEVGGWRSGVGDWRSEGGRWGGDMAYFLRCLNIHSMKSGVK
jgi:hypothetical protein